MIDSVFYDVQCYPVRIKAEKLADKLNRYLAGHCVNVSDGRVIVFRNVVDCVFIAWVFHIDVPFVAKVSRVCLSSIGGPGELYLGSGE